MDVLAEIELAGDGTALLRRATLADVPALVALIAADQLGASRDGVRGEADLAAYTAAFEAIDADPAHLLLVAEAGGQVAGTLQLSFLPGLARRGALRAQVEAFDDARGDEVRLHAFQARRRGVDGVAGRSYSAGGVSRACCDGVDCLAAAHRDRSGVER